MSLIRTHILNGSKITGGVGGWHWNTGHTAWPRYCNGTCKNVLECIQNTQRIYDAANLPKPELYLSDLSFDDLLRLIVTVPTPRAVHSGGCTCRKCNSRNEYAEPNQKDGTYVCYECR